MFNKEFFSRKLRLGILDPHFGIDPDSETAGRLRARQMAAIASTTPLMVLANLLCGTFICVAFWNEQSARFLPYWIIALYLVSGIGLYHSYVNSKRGEVRTASKRAYTKAVKGAVTMGAIWALMPILLYSNIPIEQRIIVIAILSGLMGGGAMSLYVVPRAMLAWLFILTAGCSIALFNTMSFSSMTVFGVLVIYSISLIRAGNSMAKTFTNSIVTGFTLSDQSETIGMLLKDFSENVSDWLWEINTIGQIIRGQDEFSQTLRVNFESISPGEDNNNLIGGDHRILNMRSLESLRFCYNQHRSFRDMIISSKGRDGEIWVSLSGKPLYDHENRFQGFRGVASNITEAKLAEERIAYLAHNDALTGLVNRENFSVALNDMFKNEGKSAQWSAFYLDLDGFKNVNDTYGHSTGDGLLGEVAVRLKQCVTEHDVVARLGGDEFAILCKSAVTVQSASALAERIVESISQPYLIDRVALSVSVSIGVAFGNADGGRDVNTVMNNADLALYRAKAEGRNTFRLYKHGMDEIIKERRNLEADLRSALHNGEFSLCYQPLVSAKDMKTTGFEALVRWMHPERGSIPPSDFIPIAERMGIIAEIGDWVIHQACKEAITWPSHLSVAVNLSPQQFNNNRIIKTVISALTKSGLAPSRLEVEITEGLFMENTEEIMFDLRELKSMGIMIAMDDFGTGYSSLSYLLKFPFDKLKIDRSLIVSLDEDLNAKNVLEAITKLGSIMDLTITAEGIETPEQLEMLRDINCSQFQGFLFGKPLMAEQVDAFLLEELGRETNGNKATHDINTAA